MTNASERPRSAVDAEHESTTREPDRLGAALRYLAAYRPAPAPDAADVADVRHLTAAPSRYQLAAKRATSWTGGLDRIA